MPGTKDSKRTTAARAPASSGRSTANLFAPNNRKGAANVTRERIEEDMERFRKAGGHIEVLGTTRTLKQIQPDAVGVPPARHARKGGHTSGG